MVLRNIECFGVTHLFLPPTAFYALLAHPDVGRFDYSSLRIFLLAGSPVSPDKLKQGVEVFGPCMCQCYGQTEAPMLLTWLDTKTVAAAAAGDHPERLRSCGQPTSAVRLAVMGDAGSLLPPGECGVIGVPDDVWGEAVKAIIVLRDGECLTEDAVITHCKAGVGGVKAPKSVEFRQEIPKTPAGKIDRKNLREPYRAGV